MYTPRKGDDSLAVVEEFQVCLREELARRGRGRKAKLRFEDTPEIMTAPVDDERFSRLISNISYLRNEIGHVCEDYQHERTGWLAAISHLQQQLAELSRAVAARRADLKAQAERERNVTARQALLEQEVDRERQAAQLLHEQNRHLANTLEKERRDRPFEDKQKKKALEDLVTELVTIKKELTDLRTRYNEERRRWKYTNDSLDERVKILMKENEGEGQALAESTMFYYNQFGQLKKENFVVKEELREEKQRSKALAIQLEVAREELMRAKGIGEEKHEAELGEKDEFGYGSPRRSGEFGSGGPSRPISRTGSNRRSAHKLSRGLSFADDEPIAADAVFDEDGARNSAAYRDPAASRDPAAYRDSVAYRDPASRDPAAYRDPGNRDNEMAARIMDLERKMSHPGENQDLNMQLSQTRGDNDSLMKDRQKSVDATAAELTAVKDKNADLVNKYKALEQELDLVKKEKDDNDREVQRLQDESAVKKKELNDMKEEMKKRTDELNQLQQTADDADKQKRDLEDKEGEIRRLRAELDELKKKEEASRAKMEKIKSGLSSTKSDCDKLRTHFDDLSSMV